MSASLTDLLGRFVGRRILVAGEAMLDAYLHGRVERLAREAPVPVVSVADTIDAPGGAANTAANVAALGGTALLASVVGDDGEGQRLLGALAAMGVSGDGVIVQPGRRSLAKQRLIAMDQILLRFDTGSTDPPEADLDAALAARLEALVPTADAIVVSDYGYGVLTPRAIGVIEKLRRPDQPLIADARELRRYRHLHPTLAKPNYGEAVRLLGLPEEHDPRKRRLQILPAADRLLELTGADAVAVTIDQDGSYLFERGHEPYRTYARPRSQARAAGAGDTFVAALALSLGAGADAAMAVELASAAAAVVVGKDGTSTCAPAEVSAYLGVGDKAVSDAHSLGEVVAFERSQGHRIVFTNGCFDILHRGHIAYLNRAKTLGDVLIVGVNSDASVRRLKGDTRPINPLDDRLEVLEALSCVDRVIAFDEETPEALVDVVRPDVFVKGGDYRTEDLPEARLVEAYGGSVQILPYVEDRSTTSVIERVRGAVTAEMR